MNPLLDTISAAWGWRGIKPVKIDAINAFGCVLLENVDGSYWLIRTDEPSCEKVADNKSTFAEIRTSQDFLIDWEMNRLVDAARQKYGKLNDGYCYCLKIPATLGGQYEISNFATITINEYLSFSGYLAQQIENLPDGASIKIDCID